MNRVKYLSVALFSALLTGFVVVACNNEKEADPAAEGEKAGEEMCACVASIAEPVLPNPPSSPLPPEGVDIQEIFGLDLTDPEVIAGLEPDVLAYLMDPVIQAYFAAVQAVYEAYFTELGNCAGAVAAKYQKYFGMDMSKYDEDNPDLFSVFEFHDKNFETEFLKAAGVCAAAFVFE